MAAPADAQQEIDGTHPEPAAEPAAAAGPPRTGRSWSHTAAHQAAVVSSKLTPLLRSAGDQVAAAAPMTLLAALLGLLATLGIVASLTLDNSVGVASTVLFVPIASAAFGAVAMRRVDDLRRDQVRRADAHREASQLRQAERTLGYVDTKLSAAVTEFGSEGHNEAVIAMFQAKAVTELYLGPDRRQAPELPNAAERYPSAALPGPETVHRGERSERPPGLSLIGAD